MFSQYVILSKPQEFDNFGLFMKTEFLADIHYRDEYIVLLALC
jgi:hypothetical protein